MQAFRIAVATGCFNEPIKESIRTAAVMGASAVQLNVRDELTPTALSDTGRRQFLHHLDEIGLKVGSMTFPSRRTYVDPEHLEARIAATKDAMQFTAQLKATVLTARIGRIPDDKESKDYRLMHDILSDLAHYGNHVGVTFAITPTLDTPEALLELINSIKTGLIGLDFDPAAFVAAKQKPEKSLRLLHAVVTHFQARDAIRDIDGSGLEVPLGRGEVEWVELLPLLNEIDYRGWVTVNRTQGDDKVGDCRRAVQFLKQVVF